MFKTGEMIAYGAYGVCRITEIAPRTMCGQTQNYYILEPVYQGGSTFFVPVDSQALTAKMHKVLSPDEARALMTDIPAEPCEWIDNDAQRLQEFRAVLGSGDRRRTVRIMKALYRHEQTLKNSGRKFHLNDERVLKDAEKLLYQELAAVLEQQPEEIKQAALPLLLAEA